METRYRMARHGNDKSMSNLTRRHITDDLGIPKVVLLPAGETDTRLGIPVSLDLSTLYAHMPPAFVQTLTGELHNRGLIEPCDYLKPGAAELYRAALLSVIRHDFLSIQTLAKEVCNHG